MTVTMRLTFSSPDVHEAIGQTVKAFETALDFGQVDQAAFSKIEELALCFGVSHPAMPSPRKGRASYSKDTGIFFSEAYLDYGAWAGGVWADRVAAVAQAAKSAIAAVPKTRLSPEERVALLAMIETRAGEIARARPERLYPLEPIFVIEDDHGRWKSTSFRAPKGAALPGSGLNVRTLQPEELAIYFAAHEHQGPAPLATKFYRRDGSKLRYREAWADGSDVVTHIGICGERGELSSHPANSLQAQRKLMAAFGDAAAADGFKQMPEERLIGLLVRKALAKAPTEADLRRRHELEDFLNETTGWLGLGHCDGGSIGAGSIEAFCLVVDYEIAAAAISRELAASGFSDFIVCRDPQE